MLKQASVGQIRRGEISRADGYIAVTMCIYPRGLRRELRDEYQRDLAPTRELFKDFKKYEKEFGHEAAFSKSRYQERFTLTPEAWENLKRLVEISRHQSVYLVCQCEVGERCHREILLLLAKEKFKARAARVFHDYPTAVRRLTRQKASNVARRSTLGPKGLGRESRI